jgi:hypothetical protein
MQIAAQGGDLRRLDKKTIGYESFKDTPPAQGCAPKMLFVLIDT